MAIKEFIHGISFNHIQPETPVDSSIKIETEINNTRLPKGYAYLKPALSQICLIPKMSTFAIGCIINQAVKKMSKKCAYVNVGVWHGFTLLAGMVENRGKKCIGIDNFSEFDGPRNEFLANFNRLKSGCHYFYEMDYVKYFEEVHRGPIGVYMYDGHHSYENQQKGLQLAEPFFSKACIIIVDDTNWHEPRSATLNFIRDSRHNYRIVFDRRTSGILNPTFWNGIMVLQKV